MNTTAFLLIIIAYILSVFNMLTFDSVSAEVNTIKDSGMSQDDSSTQNFANKDTKQTKMNIPPNLQVLTNKIQKFTTNSTNQSTQKVAPNLGDAVSNLGGMVKELPTKPPTIPSTVHLRFVIDNIQVYNDHDGDYRADGEWHLYGLLSCCGGAVNSNMPTKAFSFNSPGAKEGEIDTPDNQMNDVTGEWRGGWGTVETVKFKTVYQDIDVDNTNPLSEIQLDLFGVEDDSLSSSDLPSIPDVPSTSYDDYARYAESAIMYFNNLKGADDLGKVHAVFNRENNYGVGAGSLASDMIYQNKYYKTQYDEATCGYEYGNNCKYIDWPDFSDYIINYHIEDKEKRCAQGFEFQYATGQCKVIPIK